MVCWRFTVVVLLCVEEWGCVSGMRAFVEVLCVVEYFWICVAGWVGWSMGEGSGCHWRGVHIGGGGGGRG